SMSPPRIAPGMLPRPPRMIMMKAFSSGCSPIIIIILGGLGSIPGAILGGDAAQAAENDNDEGLQQWLLAHHRVELEDRRHERPAGGGEGEADREREAVDDVHV